VRAEKILALSNYLSMSPKSYNEIAQFLVMDTFIEDSVFCLYIGELIETGVICALGGFGWTSEEYSSFFDIPIHEKYPLTEAIRNKQIVDVNFDEAFLKTYPHMTTFSLSTPWKSGVAIPTYPIGGIALCSSKKITLDPISEVFFMAVGSLLGLYASRLPLALVEVALKVKDKIDLPPVPLTDRQFVIAGMLERGFNNAQIGLEIGYSESLVRQETVAIYRKLQVTGRQAMQAIRTLNLKVEEELEESELLGKLTP
jgi:DNA-binding CsgD family transcriptional regulator